MIVDVRDDSPAKAAGMRPGMQVLAIDGEPIGEAVAALEPKFLSAPDPAAREWALQLALAGHRDRDVVLLSIVEGSGTRELSFAPVGSAPRETLLSRKLLGDVGYIRFNNSLGEDALVSAFDEALANFRKPVPWCSICATRPAAVCLRSPVGSWDASCARPHPINDTS